MSRTFIQRLFLVGILIAAGLLLAILVFRYPTRNIPVLAVQVETGRTIEERMIKQISWPENAVYAGLILTVDELVGKTAAVPIAPGVPLTLNLVSAGGASDDPRFPGARIEDKFRVKVFVGSDLARSSGNTIVIGDYVNVIWRNPETQRAEILMQKVRVVGARSEQGLGMALGLTQVTVGTSGAKNVRPVGYLLSLDMPLALKLLAYAPESVLLVPTSACAPSLGSEIPMGVAQSELSCVDSVTPGVIVNPTPSPVPSGTPDPVIVSPSPSTSP